MPQRPITEVLEKFAEEKGASFGHIRNIWQKKGQLNPALYAELLERAKEGLEKAKRLEEDLSGR